MLNKSCKNCKSCKKSPYFCIFIFLTIIHNKIICTKKVKKNIKKIILKFYKSDNKFLGIFMIL